MCLAIYIVIYKIFDALTIQTQGDPFYYHLAGARIFYYQGWQYLVTDLQSYAQAGWYDAVYVIPFFFTHNKIAIQLFGQETHLLLSLFLGAFCIFRWIPNKTLAIFGAISLITISRDFVQFMYAKNDGVVASLTLITAYWIYKKKSPYLIGLGLGLISSVKMSGLIATAVLSLIYTFNERRNFKAVLKCAITSLVVISPILLRNYWMTGDPVFPGMVDHFTSKMSSSTRGYYHYFFSQPSTSFSIVQSFKDLALGKAVYWIGFVIAFDKARKRDWDGFSFFIAALAIFGFYTFSHGVYQGARFFFATFFLMIFFTFNELSKRTLNPKYFWPLLVLILVDSNVGFSGQKIYGNLTELTHHSEEELIERHIDQFRMVKAMDRHPRMPTYIYSDKPSESFHLDPQYHLIHYQHAPNADYFVKCLDVKTILPLINKYKYFWLNPEISNLCYDEIRTHTKMITTLRMLGTDESLYLNSNVANGN